MEVSRETWSFDGLISNQVHIARNTRHKLYRIDRLFQLWVIIWWRSSWGCDLVLWYGFEPPTSSSVSFNPLRSISWRERPQSQHYCMPPSAWWGFTDAAERSRLHVERLLAGLRHEGYLPEDFPSFVELALFFWCRPLQVNQFQPRPCPTTLSNRQEAIRTQSMP